MDEEESSLSFSDDDCFGLVEEDVPSARSGAGMDGDGIVAQFFHFLRCALVIIRKGEWPRGQLLCCAAIYPMQRYQCTRRSTNWFLKR